MKETFDVVRLICYNTYANVTLRYVKRFSSSSARTSGDSTKTTLLANSLGSFVELLKRRNPGRSERISIKPVDKANEIDRRRDGQVL